MADARSEVQVKATLKDEVSRATKKMQTSVAGDLKKMAIGFVGVTAAVAAFKTGVIDSIKAAAEQEQIMVRLTKNLENAGKGGARAAEEIDRWAEVQQRISGTSSNLLVQLAAQAVAMGATADQAKRAAEAADELSAATGKGLQESGQQIIKTLGGFAGELGEVIPELKELTREELRNGEAIDLLISKYGGSAAEQGDTMIGSMNRLRGAIDDVKLAFGELATAGQDGGTVGALAGAFDKIGSRVKEMAADLNRLDVSLLQALGFFSNTGVNNYINTRLDEVREQQNFVGPFDPFMGPRGGPNPRGGEPPPAGTETDPLWMKWKDLPNDASVGAMVPFGRVDTGALDDPIARAEEAYRRSFEDQRQQFSELDGIRDQFFYGIGEGFARARGDSEDFFDAVRRAIQQALAALAGSYLPGPLGPLGSAILGNLSVSPGVAPVETLSAQRRTVRSLTQEFNTASRRGF